MAVQYDFSIDSDPYELIANKLDINENKLINILNNLYKKSILKRIGFYLNYRSEGLKAALIGIAAGEEFGILRDRYSGDPLITHVYLRRHPLYNIWVVMKRNDINSILKERMYLEMKYGFKSVVLFGKRTYKLSVKFDLYSCVSRSGRYSIVPDTRFRPSTDDLRVARLVRRLPLTPRPFESVAKKLGLSEDEILARVRELLENGVLLDPGAVLDGRRIGFGHNVMVALEPRESSDYDELCRCVAEQPWTTHVVLRESHPPGAWRHLCYFMVHSCSRPLVERVIHEILDSCPVKDFLEIESVADLKPGVVR